MAKYVNMRLSDVRVPPEFRAHPPADVKIETRRKEYRAKQKFARNIAVTSAGILVDGYASFLALEREGVLEFRFKIRDFVTVVKARHPSHPERLYMWRSNHGAHNRFAAGDHIAVRTRYGVREAVVDEVVQMPSEECFGLDIVIGRWDPEHHKNKNHNEQEENT